jgi:hypothetical protein
MGRSCPAHDAPQFDCNDCSRTARIRQAEVDEPIKLASAVLVDVLESGVELMLNALSHPEVLVTDLRTIGNFGLDDGNAPSQVTE